MLALIGMCLSFTVNNVFEVHSFFEGLDIEESISNGKYKIIKTCFSDFVGSAEDTIVESTKGESVELNDCFFKDNTCGNMIRFMISDSTKRTILDTCCLKNNKALGDKSLVFLSYEVKIENNDFTMNDCTNQEKTGLMEFTNFKKVDIKKTNMSNNNMNQGFGAFNIDSTEYKVITNIFVENTLSSRANKFHNGLSTNFFDIYCNDQGAQIGESLFVNNTLKQGSSLFYLHSNANFYNIFVYMSDESSGFNVFYINGKSYQINNCLFRYQSYVNGLSYNGNIGTTTALSPSVFSCKYHKCDAVQATASASLSVSPSQSPSRSLSPSASISPSQSPSQSVSPSASISPSHSVSPSSSQSVSPTPSNEPTSSPSMSVSVSFTPPRTFPPQGCALSQKLNIKVMPIRNSLIPLLAGIKLEI